MIPQHFLHYFIYHHEEIRRVYLSCLSCLLPQKTIAYHHQQHHQSVVLPDDTQHQARAVRVTIIS